MPKAIEYKVCPKCNKTSAIEFENSQYYKWALSGFSASELPANMSESNRRTLYTSVCAECQNRG